jgi:fatty acid desaturase
VASSRAAVLRHPAEWRQLAIVGTYLAVILGMYFVPAARNPVLLAFACWLSFLNAVVLHNSLHQGPFTNQRVNLLWRMVLSFAVLYPASANIPAHNLVHHHFDDDGQPDWVAPEHARFRWHLLNLIHFPNLVGTRTFNGTTRWRRLHGRGDFRRQYRYEQIFAFGLTGALLFHDFWAGLFFVVLPQLYGSRCILRINLIQHDGCDISSEWNHSRNFVGKAFNWVMCNNGLHTIHHNRAGLHWSDLWEHHQREVVPRIHPSLNERSMILFLLRTYVLRFSRPTPVDVASAEENVAAVDLASREVRRAEIEAAGNAV